MKTKEQIEKLLDKIMDQYQKAGNAYFNNTNSLDVYIWSTEILDSCAAAIDVLSWVIEDEDLSVSGKLTGECGCDPSKPFGCDETAKEGYVNSINKLKRLCNEGS